MPYAVLNTRAVILSTQATGEANRILTVLTEHSGVLHIFARSIRSEKSRMRAAAVPYALVSLSTVLGRQHILKDVRIIDPLTAIWGNETVYTSYVTLLHFIRSVVPAVGQNDSTLFSIITNAITSYTTRPPSQADCILLTSQVFILRHLGYMHDRDLDDLSFSDTLSRTVTSKEQQTSLRNHLRKGMEWQ